MTAAAAVAPPSGKGFAMRRNTLDVAIAVVIALASVAVAAYPLTAAYPAPRAEAESGRLR